MKKYLFFLTLLLSFLQGFSQPEFPVTYPPYSRYDFLPLLRFNPAKATWTNYKTPAFSLSGIDSVRVIGDSVCQFKNGTRTCYFVNGGGSSGRFSYPGEDVSTDVNRDFNARGFDFHYDSLGVLTFNTQKVFNLNFKGEARPFNTYDAGAQRIAFLGRDNRVVYGVGRYENKSFQLGLHPIDNYMIGTKGLLTDNNMVYYIGDEGTISKSHNVVEIGKKGFIDSSESSVLVGLRGLIQRSDQSVFISNGDGGSNYGAYPNRIRNGHAIINIGGSTVDTSEHSFVIGEHNIFKNTNEGYGFGTNIKATGTYKSILIGTSIISNTTGDQQDGNFAFGHDIRLTGAGANQYGFGKAQHIYTPNTLQIGMGSSYFVAKSDTIGVHINGHDIYFPTDGNPADTLMTLAKFRAGGGGTTPGLQAVITANNKLNKNDTLNLQGHDFLTDSAGTITNRVNNGYVIETLSGNQLLNQDVSGELSSFDNSNHLKFHSDADGTLDVYSSDGAGGFANRFHIDAGGANVDAYFQNLAKFQVNANDSISLQAPEIDLRALNTINIITATDNSINISSGGYLNLSTGNGENMTLNSAESVIINSNDGADITLVSAGSFNLTAASIISTQGSIIPTVDATDDLGSGSKGFKTLSLGTTTDPSTPDSGKLVLFYDGTHLKAKDSSGTVHTIF